ncbi:MAG: ORF6N domain-containing protein, partial [Candidatus Paceibacterota bacterium]
MSQAIESRIFIAKGQRVILDRDLADLYGVKTKRLNEQVTRNIERFPPDFMFSLNIQEVTDLKSPRVFTEYGAVMAANVL